MLSSPRLVEMMLEALQSVPKEQWGGRTTCIAVCCQVLAAMGEEEEEEQLKFERDNLVRANSAGVICSY